MAKEFGNFENIKKQMIEQKKQAEEVKPKEPQNNINNNEEEVQKEEIFSLTITLPSMKAKKKSVNYYLSENLINRIKTGAELFNKRDSVFLEEIMDQVLKNLNL